MVRPRRYGATGAVVDRLRLDEQRIAANLYLDRARQAEVEAELLRWRESLD